MQRLKLSIRKLKYFGRKWHRNRGRLQICMRLSRKGTVEANLAQRSRRPADHGTVFRSENQEKLGDQDVNSTLQDMQEAKQKLLELQAQPISRVNGKLVVFLFYLILERVWRVLWCTAYQKKPAAFSQQEVPFWDLIVLQHDGAHYEAKALPGLKTECPKAFDLLQAAMEAWMPFHGENGTIFYNTVGFWLHAAAEGHSVEQEMFKIPNSPAAGDYTDINENKMYPLGDVDMKRKYYGIYGNGFNVMPAKLAVDEIVGVLFEIYSDLEDMVRACV